MESKTSVTNGHIVAMGGGGFSMAPENPLLDDFVLSLSRRQPARVCFIPTASADSTTYIVRFYRSFAGRCIPTDLTLSEGPLPRHSALTSQIARFVAEQDVIYVGGGNTANLLALWRTHGLDVELRKAWSNGAVLAGVSAGMLCWFCGGVTDSYGGLALLRDGLGLVEATACPHYDGEPQRRPTYHRVIAEGAAAGFATDDGAALHFVGSTLVEAVSSRPDAGAYRVERTGWRCSGDSAACSLLRSCSRGNPVTPNNSLQPTKPRRRPIKKKTTPLAPSRLKRGR